MLNKRVAAVLQAVTSDQLSATRLSVGIKPHTVPTLLREVGDSYSTFERTTDQLFTAHCSLNTVKAVKTSAEDTKVPVLALAGRS